MTTTVRVVKQVQSAALMAEGTQADPTVVRLHEDTETLILWTCCGLLFTAGLSAVTSFRS